MEDILRKIEEIRHLKKGKQYEMALLNLETYYSFPNIDSTNNSFKYSPDNGKNWFTITIPKGSFSADEKKQPL